MDLPVPAVTRHGPGKMVNLPPTSYRITDADEEVFLLYTNLASRKVADGSTTFRGLGHIDSHEDTLTISLRLDAPYSEGRDNVLAPGSPSHKSRRSAKGKTRAVKIDEETLDVEIVQDKTALRSRKGDTGSVLWHASVDFAQVILQQLHRMDPQAFLDREALLTAHVLELGAGTGLLGVVLSRFVRHYTVTDIADLVPLIRKNISRNFPSASTKGTKVSPSKSHPNVTATPLDWLELQRASSSIRPSLVPEDPADLLLVVDCIYHPSLLPALLTTIDYLTIPDKTVVVVAVELRAEDVVREFLQRWLDMAAEGRWEMWSVNGLMDGPYAVWVGWKVTS